MSGKAHVGPASPGNLEVCRASSSSWVEKGIHAEALYVPFPSLRFFACVAVLRNPAN